MKNKIDWQTGIPNMNGSYLVTIKYCIATDPDTGKRIYTTGIATTIWGGFWHQYDDERSDCRVIAWCNFRDIEPYVEM